MSLFPLNLKEVQILKSIMLLADFLSSDHMLFVENKTLTQYSHSSYI